MSSFLCAVKYKLRLEESWICVRINEYFVFPLLILFWCYIPLPTISAALLVIQIASPTREPVKYLHSADEASVQFTFVCYKRTRTEGK